MHLATHPLSLAVLLGLSSIAGASPTHADAFAPPPADASTRTVAGRASVARSMDLVQRNPAALKGHSGDRFVARQVIVAANGAEHVRMDRTYNGLPVIGGDVVVHSRDGAFRSASLTLASNQRPSLLARLSADDAAVAAGVAFGQPFTGAPSTRRVVYARIGTPVLAYEVVLRGTRADRTPIDMHVFIDARSGTVLDQWDTVCTAVASPAAEKSRGSTLVPRGFGKGLYVGDVALSIESNPEGGYRLVDPKRGNNFTMDGRTYVAFQSPTIHFGDGSLDDGLSVGVDVHYGIAATWDFYKFNFGRLGVHDDNKGVQSYVIAPGTRYDNAFWEASSGMTYGDGDGIVHGPLVSLDITGHEMSHGVNQATANLVYSGDAGGLNEGNSDIFGALVEYSANNASDPGDFLIGEKIFKSNPTGTIALRYMFKPDLDGVSYSCYPARGFNPRRYFINDPHWTSGVANRFFYLLSQGSVVPAGFGAGTPANLTPASLVCSGSSTLVGIGNAKSGAIWYAALTRYFTSLTSYPQARVATLQAATDLYGAGSAEVAAVAAAWSATDVN